MEFCIGKFNFQSWQLVAASRFNLEAIAKAVTFKVDVFKWEN